MITLAFVLLTLVLTLISTIASAGQEIRVTNYGETGFSPAIYNNRIIWLDGVLHMRDLSTGKETGITNQSVTFPAIYNDRTVWVDRRTGESPASWFWDFGDGINSKHAMNATHTFADHGLYNVTLTVTNKIGSNTVIKPDYVAVMP